MLQSKDRVAEWIRIHDPHICCLQETHLRTKGLHRLKVKGWKQIFQANGQEQKNRGSNTHIRQDRLQKKGHKERILKVAKEKQEVTYKGAPIRLGAYFSMETLQARRQWQEFPSK